jgi:hypothetical protein
MTRSTEFAKAYAIAERVPGRFTDDLHDDMAILAREFLCQTERAARNLSWLRTGYGNQDFAVRDRNAWFYELVQVIDPDGFAEGRYGKPSQ